MFKKIRNLIILVIIIGLGYGAYVVFVSKKEPSGTLSNTNTNQVASAGNQKALRTGQELLILLNNLKTISLDTTIFSEQSEPFNRLLDYSVQIERDKNPGRINPFAPLGVDPLALPVNGPGADTILDPFGAPPEPLVVVHTIDASNIQITSAKLNAELLVADDTTKRWFEWGLAEDNMDKHSPEFPQKTTGVFGFVATGLTSKTKYFYRAVVKTGDVVTYGATLSFTTN